MRRSGRHPSLLLLSLPAPSSLIWRSWTSWTFYPCSCGASFARTLTRRTFFFCVFSFYHANRILTYCGLCGPWSSCDAPPWQTRCGSSSREGPCLLPLELALWIPVECFGCVVIILVADKGKFVVSALDVYVQDFAVFSKDILQVLEDDLS